MPKPGDLRMYVESEPYEVVCGACHGTRLSLTIKPEERNVRLECLSQREPCPFCRGTGSRTVRLRGWARIVRDRFSLLVFYKDGFYDSLSEMELCDHLTKGHRAGTLPAELYRSDENPDGLEESDA